MSEKLKVWFLTNAPSPYQMEYAAAIQQRIDLDVRLMRAGYDGAAWDAGKLPANTTIMKAWGAEKWRDEFRLHPAALREVLFSSHDVYVLSGLYTSPTFVLCALILWLRRKPWAVWFERPWPEDYRPSWSRRASSRSGLLRFIRRIILRCILRSASQIFCIGTKAWEEYEDLGGQPDKLKQLPYICDLQRFSNLDKERVQEVKNRYKLDNKTVFLFSGALTERKGVDLLIRAFDRLTAEHSDIALLLLGDGDQKSVLMDMVQPSLGDRVYFAGHVDQADLPAYFGAADVFVFPSRHDGWGVVINEACGASLPIISTLSTGAVHDLVRNEYNGFVLERDDEQGFYDKMKWFVNHREQIRIYGDRSEKMAEPFSLPHGVERFERAVQTCLKMKGVKS